MTGGRSPLGRVRCQAVALDFGGTITTGREDHLIGQQSVDPLAAAALHELARLGLRLILATNASATETRCPAADVLFAGDRIDYDVAAPMRAGMQACLVRPGGLRPGEQLPEGALMIGHVAELPALLGAG